MAKSSRLAPIVSRQLVVVPDQYTIYQTVRLMIDQQISSVLVKDRQDQVVGIFTERDIVRKVVLLEDSEKLKAKIITVMSRPIIFADEDNLEHSVINLHLEHGFRHFPVRSQKSTHVDHIVGIITVTDLFRKWQRSVTSVADLPKVFFLCGDPSTLNSYRRLLKVHGIECRAAENGVSTDDLMEQACLADSYLILDMDFYSTDENVRILKQARQGKLVLLTSQEVLLRPYRQNLNPEFQHIFLKPVDLSYLAWLIEKDFRSLKEIS